MADHDSGICSNECEQSPLSRLVDRDSQNWWWQSPIYCTVKPPTIISNNEPTVVSNTATAHVATSLRSLRTDHRWLRPDGSPETSPDPSNVNNFATPKEIENCIALLRPLSIKPVLSFWLHGDSGPLIICMFWNFEHESTTLMLCKMKMRFMLLLVHLTELTYSTCCYAVCCLWRFRRWWPGGGGPW
jgi:hypothetical protein